MGKYASREVLDGPLDVVINNTTHCCGCFGEPQNLADVKNLLGVGGVRVTTELVMTPAYFSKQWNGLNRELVMFDLNAEQVVEGSIDHVALYNVVKLLEVTTVDVAAQDPVPIPVGMLVPITDWVILIEQPT